MSTVISLYSSPIFSVNPSPIFVSKSQSIPPPPLQRNWFFLYRNKQKHFWLHLLGLSHLDWVSNHHWKTEVSRVSSFIHHDNINQPSKVKYFFKSEPQCSPESQHTKDNVGGNTFLATLVPREVGCCFLNQTAQLFWCFRRSLCSVKHRKGHYYTLEVRDMRSSHHFIGMRVISQMRCFMLWAINTLDNRKGHAFSGLAFLIPSADASHAKTELLPAACLPLADLS